MSLICNFASIDERLGCGNGDFHAASVDYSRPFHRTFKIPAKPHVGSEQRNCKNDERRPSTQRHTRMIQVTDTIVLNDRDVNERFVRATGARGQNVNKEATAVELRVDIERSSLPPDVKKRLMALAGRHVTTVACW